MLIFKTKYFARWAKKMRITDLKLTDAIVVMDAGLVGTELGKGLYKKRLAFQNTGKRSGGRAIIVYRKQEKAFFIYGFAKNEKENISAHEEQAFKNYAAVLLGMNKIQ